MITAQEVHDKLEPSIQHDYFHSLEVKYSKEKDTYEFKIFADFTTDLLIAGKDTGLIRLDYEISRPTIEEGWDEGRGFKHLGKIFWQQMLSDVALGVLHMNYGKTPNFDIVGRIHPDLTPLIESELAKVTSWSAYQDYENGVEVGAYELPYVRGAYWWLNERLKSEHSK